MANDWWAKKLGTPTPQPQQTYTPQAPLQQPQPVFQQPQQPQYPPSQQIQMSPKCPSCGSGNYGGTAESRARCYDCGYPITQSGSGMGTGIIGQGGQSAGPAAPAKQISTGGWNPTTIIGHI